MTGNSTIFNARRDIRRPVAPSSRLAGATPLIRTRQSGQDWLKLAGHPANVKLEATKRLRRASLHRIDVRKMELQQ